MIDWAMSETGSVQLVVGLGPTRVMRIQIGEGVNDYFQPAPKNIPPKRVEFPTHDSQTDPESDHLKNILAAFGPIHEPTPDESTQSLKTAVKRMLKLQKMTQKTLAKRLDMHESQLSREISNATSDRPELMARIIAALDIPAPAVRASPVSKA